MSDHTDNDILLDLVYKEGRSAAQWREIGTRLKVNPSKLDEIEWAHHRSPTECLVKTINAWRNQYSDPETLETFKSALR